MYQQNQRQQYEEPWQGPNPYNFDEWDIKYPGGQQPQKPSNYNTKTSHRFISFLADLLPALIAYFVFTILLVPLLIPVGAIIAVFFTIVIVYGGTVYLEGTQGLSFGRWWTHTRLVRADTFQPIGLPMAALRACSFCLWCWMPFPFLPLLPLWSIGLLVFWASLWINIFMVPITGQTLQDKIFGTVVISQ